MDDSDFISWEDLWLEDHKDNFSSTLKYAIESWVVQVIEGNLISDLQWRFVRIMKMPGITICPVMWPNAPLIIRLWRRTAQLANTGELVNLSN